MNYLFIWRHAEGKWKSIVPFESRFSIMVPDILFSYPVEYDGLDAGADVLRNFRKCFTNK